MIQLIVGLGNPGEEHLTDRHNAGFWLCDLLAKTFHINFANQSAFKAQVAKVVENGKTIWLAKPQTFMNLSGESIGAIARFYQLKPAQVLIVHDELDLPPGVTKLKFSGGTGGHNGLKSTTQHLGTPDYWRLRVGIGHPRNLVPEGSPHQEVVNFVLKRPPQKELDLIYQSFDKFLQVLPQLTSGDPEGAMKTLHTP
jgi:peptidyl-tRNA hydrolase, PTH1 family